MAKVTDVLGRPHSGVLPYVVIGIVTDNVDEDKLGRVKVKFPTLHGEPQSHWLRVLTPHAGPTHGLYALPDVDTEVLVAFLQGSHDVGVVLGQFWNGVDLPPKEAEGAQHLPTVWEGERSKAAPEAGSGDLQKNDRRLWRSRSGHVIAFDDTQGKESVQIWDKSGGLALVFDTTTRTIVLQSGTGDLHVRAKQDLYLEAGGNLYYQAGQNIEGKSGMDTVHEAGQKLALTSSMDTEVKAGMNLKLEASVNFEAQGKVNATLKGNVNLTLQGGAQAELNGGAMAKIVGGMVMIN